MTLCDKPLLLLETWKIVLLILVYFEGIKPLVKKVNWLNWKTAQKKQERNYQKLEKIKVKSDTNILSTARVMAGLKDWSKESTVLTVIMCCSHFMHVCNITRVKHRYTISKKDVQRLTRTKASTTIFPNNFPSTCLTSPTIELFG